MLRGISRSGLSILIFILFLFLLAAMSNGSFPPKHKRNGWTLSPDAGQYMRMADGQAVKLPFAYRWLLPELVRSLARTKLHPLYGFIVLNILSMALFYTLFINVLLELNVPLRFCFMGVLSTFVFWHTYLLKNLFLVDQPALVFIMLAIYGLVTRQALIFVLAVIVGVHFKESVLFIAPAWLVTKDYKTAILIMLFGFTSYLIPRLAYDGMSGYLFAHGRAQGYVNITQPSRFIYYGLTTWGGAWVTGIMGIAMAKRKDLVAVTWCLAAGAFVSLWFAGDFGRMFAIMVPVIGIGSAIFFKDFWQQQNREFKYEKEF